MKRNLLIILTLSIGLFVYSQSNNSDTPNTVKIPTIANYSNLPAIMPKSPEAASLMKAIMFPVSYSKGLPQIEIPLYEIKLKDGTVLPIKLTYHASGFKPSEVKQRVGIGWTLEAEPEIARSVNGEPDEDYFLTHFNHQNLIGENENENSLSAIYGGGADFQPDHFFYRLINKTGKYISKSPVNGDGDARKCFFTVPYDPITIEGFPNDGFNINDNGYQYSFTKQNSISKIKTKLDDYSLAKYPTIYKANEIKSPLNEVITFNYSGNFTKDNTPEDPYDDFSDNTEKIIRKINRNSYSVWIEEPVVLQAGLGNQADGTVLNLGYGDQWSMNSLYYNVWQNTSYTPNSEFGARIKVTRDWYDFDSNQSKKEISLLMGNGLVNVDTYPSGYSYGICDFFSHASGDKCDTNIPFLYKNRTVEKIGELKNIQFPGGSIEFVDREIIPGQYNVIDFIQVKDLQNNIIKKIKFISHVATTDKPRAILDKICFLNNDGTTEYEYKLDYYTDTNELTGSASDDFAWNNWYSENAQPKFYKPVVYKGNTLRYGLVPEEDINSIYQKRMLYDTFAKEPAYDPDKEEAQVYEEENFGYRNQFVLKKITYPTGGSCQFNYGPNRFEKYEDYDNGNETVNRLFYYYPGGIRIKEIDYYDKANVLSSRRIYKYGKNENGSGIPFMEVKPEDFVISDNKKFTCIISPGSYTDVFGKEHWNADYKPGDSKEVYVQTYLTQPIVNPYYDVGTTILYDEVAEYYDVIQNGSTNSIKTIYKYDLSGIENICPQRQTYTVNGNTIYTPVVTYNLDQWKIGKLASEEQWGLNSNLQSKLISKKDYTYKTIHSNCIQNYYIPYSYTSQESIYGAYVLDCEITSSHYTSLWGRITGKSKGIWYSQNPPTMLVPPEATGVVSPVQTQSAKVLDVVRDSTDGVITVKKYSYDESLKHLNPTEMTLSGNDVTKPEYKEKYFYSGDDNINPLATCKIINTLVSKESWKNNQMTCKLQNNYLIYNNAFPALNEVLVGKNNTLLETRLRYHNYDIYGNPVFISKDDATFIVYLWSYQGQHPVAEIKNATYTQVTEALSVLGTNPANIADSEEPDMNTIDALRTSTKLPATAMVTTYTYRPLVGMLTAKDPNGLVTTYVYDDASNRLQFVKDSYGNKVQENQYHYRNQ